MLQQSFLVHHFFIYLSKLNYWRSTMYIQFKCKTKHKVNKTHILEVSKYKLDRILGTLNLKKCIKTHIVYIST